MVAKKNTKRKHKKSQTSAGKKTTASKTASVPKKQLRKRSEGADRAFLRAGKNRGSGQQSGDLQGLSIVEGADSESVSELLGEGNAFEADAVKGVEDAGGGVGREGHTHEVPED